MTRRLHKGGPGKKRTPPLSGSYVRHLNQACLPPTVVEIAILLVVVAFSITSILHIIGVS